MRAAEGSHNRRRSQITATSIYLVLVVIPILGAMLVAWQVGSRLFFSAGRSDSPVAVVKISPDTRARSVQPEPAKVAVQPAPVQVGAAPAAPVQPSLPADTGSTTASRAEPVAPSAATPPIDSLLPNPT